MHEAILWEKGEQDKTTCNLCRHRCVLKPGRRGICGVRENREGRLFTLVYDRVAAEGVDPIEKKPFFHFLPSSLAYSIATMGCNFSCAHCQNCHLSRSPADTGVIEGRKISPEDTARIAKERGLYTNFVTNGYESPELIEKLTGLIDAANIDLKAFSKDFYKKVCHADLEGVLETLALMHGAGIWIEVTTLLIPGLNDGQSEVEAIAEFIANLDENIPWHISRYHPAYRMLYRPSTSIESLVAARNIGRAAGLRYVFTGNVPGDEGESTYCHACGRVLIGRYGFTVKKMHLKDGRCPDCGTRVVIRFE
jgi:pyruvate formate lyase activating enzyme